MPARPLGRPRSRDRCANGSRHSFAANLPRRPNGASGCTSRARFATTSARRAALKQAIALGLRTAAVNWAWRLAGVNRTPSRFTCTRFFAELGVHGLDSCDAEASLHLYCCCALIAPRPHSFSVTCKTDTHSLS
ncbi:hypothetical protein J1614_002343 [Plenodomus biglobosus]|nr:hypothetical protein J1614_002343 [Plenodomus biglobosus]